MLFECAAKTSTHAHSPMLLVLLFVIRHPAIAIPLLPRVPTQLKHREAQTLVPRPRQAETRTGPHRQRLISETHIQTTHAAWRSTFDGLIMHTYKRQLCVDVVSKSGWQPRIDATHAVRAVLTSLPRDPLRACLSSGMLHSMPMLPPFTHRSRSWIGLGSQLHMLRRS